MIRRQLITFVLVWFTYFIGETLAVKIMPLCASLTQNVGIDATDPTLRHCAPKAYISELAYSISGRFSLASALAGLRQRLEVAKHPRPTETMI